MKKKNNKKFTYYIISIILFLTFIGLSYFFDYEQGQQTGIAFSNVMFEMLKILPAAFILIGLFEVWIKKETVMKHLGDTSGIKGYLWIILLGGFSVGGLFVALPLAETLYKKGASLKIIFAYLGISGVVRVPMTIFEITFLGLPFTIARLLVTVPLFILIGIIMGIILKNKNFEFKTMETINND